MLFRSGTYAWTTKAFHDANPKVYQALANAIAEASAFIMANRREAGQYYIADTKTRADPEEVFATISAPGVSYNPAPLASATWANFLHHVGRTKVRVESWKDLFFQEIHHLPGS